MYQHATLYLTSPLDGAGVAAALAGAAVVTARPDRFVELRGDGVTVVATAMPAAELVDHLVGLRGYVAAACAVMSPDLAGVVDGTRQVLGLAIEPGFRHGDPVWRWLAALASAGAGMIFLAGAFFDPRGQPLAAPPGLELRSSAGADADPDAAAHDDAAAADRTR